MDRMIFVNLPVTDLAASRRFYTGLGFTVNEDFSDEQVACIVVSETIYVMLLDRDRFAEFVDLPVADPSTSTGQITALSAESADAVDDLVARALAHGGTARAPIADDAMYGQTFADPDGHVWEAFYMPVPG